MIAEPQLDAADIQGNIIPGFLKPHMALAALTITDVAAARRWLHSIAERVTTMADAMITRTQVREFRQRHPRPSRDAVADLNPRPEGVNDAWFNLGFSHRGLATLLAGDAARSAELGQFEDPAFALGLLKRSAMLGDPTDAAAEGHPSRWVVGSPGTEPDLLLIFAADRAEDMASLRAGIQTAATNGGLALVYQEEGAKLTARGSEHFGFKDGISQPGVRGTWGAAADHVTPRLVTDTQEPEASLYGLPGQHLVWPGEFVFGYPRQGADPLQPGPPALPGPSWSRNGSYLVFRRLLQDVAGFWSFVEQQQQRLAGYEGFENLTATQLASYLVGRWPSGAPVARSAAADIEALGESRVANNYFTFGTDAPPLPLTDGTDDFPQAAADPIGLVCPPAAHIRKVNARDTANDLGGRRATFTRRILRRGLPFGPPLPDTGFDPAQGNRGLLFVSYQTSISDQFELLCQWMNHPTNPRMPSGHDLVAGQNGQPGEARRRHCTIVRREPSGNIGSAALDARDDYVIPTGGGYFFSPSITAIREVLGAG